MITANRVKMPGAAALVLLLAAGTMSHYFFPALAAEPYQQFSRARRLFEEAGDDERKKAQNWPLILKIAPESEYALFIRAESLDSFRKQIAAYDRALAINPRFFEALLERARAKGELEDLDGAIADVNRALELRPDDFGAYIDRGAYLQRQGKLTAALADFKRALAFAQGDSDRALALLFRGEAQLEMGDAPAATATADEGLRLAANNPQLLYLRGRSRLKAGQVRAGCVDLENAVKRGENLAEMQRNQFCK